MGLKKRLAIGFLFVISSCAQVRPLEGGAKDEAAPKPDMQNASPVLGSTSISPSVIRIAFDEYIKLNNPAKTISITPELPTKPIVEVSGRELTIQIESKDLLANTTYSIVFNKAISDLNEGNDTTFTYVFSTGQFIDSLNYSVVLIDAETLQPVSDAMIGLFVSTDTLDPYTQKPKYLAQTDKTGKANFQYLGAQDLAVFAYNLNGLNKISADSPIAFRTNLIEIDTTWVTDTLRIFTPKVVPSRGSVLKKNLDSRGRITVVTNFDFEPSVALIKNNENYVDFSVEETPRSDSSIFWILAQENFNYEIQIPYQDTLISAKVSTRKIDLDKSKIINNLDNGELEINESLTFSFDFPIQSINPQNLLVYQDNVLIPEIEYSIENLRNLKILSEFEPESTFQLVILPNSITFYDGTLFTDSIVVNFKRKGASKYANLELVLENLPDMPLVIYLHSNGQIVAKQIVELTQNIVSFKQLKPGEYTIQVAYDWNNNGVWDTGSWQNNTQPEVIVWFTQPITLRANWDTKQPLAFQ